MRLGYKVLMIVGLTIALMIPVTMIRGTVQERQHYRAQAVQEVERSTAGAQVIAGPVLVVPYTDRRTLTFTDSAGVRREEEQVSNGTWIFFPDKLDLTGTLRPTPRKRGLHEVRLYELDTVVRASFRAAIPRADEPQTRRTIGAPRIGIGLRDVRGLVGVPTLRVGGTALRLRQGLGYRDESGLHAMLAPPATGATLAFDVLLEASLQGTEALSIVPIAGRTVVQLESPWPHPQFHGDFLPRTRQIDRDGFRARWEVSSLATDAQAQFSAGTRRAEAAAESAPIDVVSVSLVDPVNIYSKVDRATKYAMLFVLLTFVAFFMFEFLKELRIHPIQYGLVGLAIAIFFLLLLALSEHIEFDVAYMAAAAACVVLIGYYVAHVLGGWRRGLGFAAMLGTLYASLYGLLISEDNAMVLGAGLLFLILAAIMVLTRRVDWYRAARLPPLPGRPA